MPIKHRRQAPTQSDVARLAGVSQATVSAVVNGRAEGHRIPADTERRVREAVRELGYVANPAARSLKSKRNRLIGVHTFESVFPISSRDFYHEFLIGVEEQAVAEGHDLVLFTSTEDPDGKRQLYRDGINRLNVADGSVLLGVTHKPSDLARLAAEGYPFVHVGRRDVPGAEIAWVGADYRSGTEALVASLAGLGHRRVAYLGTSHRMEAQIDREDGYLAGCASMGIPPMPVFMKVQDLTPEWFDVTLAGGVTAFLAGAEAQADRIAELARARGLAVPSDVSVAVLVGTVGGPEVGRSWSALGIPRNDMGRAAVRLLVEMLTEPDIARDDQVLLPCTQPDHSTIAEAAR
ncbi:LacI family transcriptional regulator [Phytoactinopolyspora alkaliphila]|uniref:LacI family transcriptional regulator n=1 Tax=Phytoactinopolyspora alkaliphila TaxID=1783498 RepID=A0A6N9YMP1_9ACTN|nr:LacI family DNA-binding transcriptional regulator [Phytoactinopolyspora alkaliphila]NED96296.1 LacI family transcriptional regulator [Phytoactinopolyspora alkaliphila]